MLYVRSIALALGFAAAFAVALPAAAQDQREIAERLDELELQAAKARAELDTLTGQITDLRRAIEAAPDAPPVPAKASAEPKQNVAEGGAPPLTPEPSARRGVGFFVRLILLLVIVSAIFLISRIFFGRWKEAGEEAALAPPPATPAEAPADESNAEPAAVAAEPPSESSAPPEPEGQREEPGPEDE